MSVPVVVRRDLKPAAARCAVSKSAVQFLIAHKIFPPFSLVNEIATIISKITVAGTADIYNFSGMVRRDVLPLA